MALGGESPFIREQLESYTKMRTGDLSKPDEILSN